MVSELPNMNVRIIGFVRSELQKETRGDAVKDIVSEIILDERLTDAIYGLGRHSHIVVVYWIGMVTEPGPMKIHPHRDPKNPETGILATNAPDRPNYIGVGVVRLLEQEGNVLKVQGLSSANGDAVLDIRPYLPAIYSHPEATRVS